MKKLLVFILAMLICIPAMAAEIPFKDVPKDSWYYDGVKTAYELGLINGKGAADTYVPDAEMTYAEAIKLAACMHQSYTAGKVTLENGKTNWYDTYVEYCKTNGIIAKDYDFNAKATRSGYMEIFAKALPDEALAQMNNVPDNFIPDVKMDAEYAAPVYKLYRAGILAGVDAAHNCAPNSNIKRSEVAVILSRMMVKENRVSVGEAKPEAPKPSAEDEKIYKEYKSTIERMVKDFAENAAKESLANSYSMVVNNVKLIDSDSYFRYIFLYDVTNNSIAGTEFLNLYVYVRVPTAIDGVETKVRSSNFSDEAKAELGWGTRPADFGIAPEE